MRDGRFPPHGRRAALWGALAFVFASVLPACSGAADQGGLDSPTTTAASVSPATSRAPAASTAAPPGLLTAQRPFADFVDDSYTAWLRRHPELVTSLGIADDVGMGNDRLDDLSPEYLAGTQDLERAILAALTDYDRSLLPADEQLTYDIYRWWIEHVVAGHRWMYHDYPVHHFVNSYNDQLIRGLTEEHALDTAADAAGYIAKVSQIATQVGQLLEGLETRKDLGVLPPEFILEMTISRLKGDLRSNRPSPETVDAGQLDLYTAFVEGIRDIDGLDESARASLASEALAEVEASFVPAWIALIDHLESLRPLVTSDAGLWRLPDGADYYAYVLRDQTSTSLTAAQIHELGLGEVERVTAEMRAAFATLGYPDDAGMGELRRRAAQEGGFLSGVGRAGVEGVIGEYERLIDAATQATNGVFTSVPEAEVVIVPEQLGRGGFYVPGSADGSRPGAFHAGVAGNAIPRYIMATIAFHEAVPGHHFQIALAQELELPMVRRFTHYNAFVEGWALYAEKLAAELGMYEDDPYGDIGRLELELVRAVRLVTDTGIHAMGWSRQEARAYIESVLGDRSWSHEVDRYVVLPGQATGYMIGRNTILDLRADFASGGDADLAAFHDLVIGGGSLPLEILEQVVSAASR